MGDVEHWGEGVELLNEINVGLHLEDDLVFGRGEPYDRVGRIEKESVGVLDVDIGTEDVALLIEWLIGNASRQVWQHGERDHG